MAFNALEYLKLGKVDFIYEQTTNDREILIESIRKAKDKNEIINGFLTKLISIDPYFCFEVIYDNECYEKETKQLIREGQSLTGTKALNIIKNTSWGLSYVCSILASINFTEEEWDEFFRLLLEDYSNNMEYIEFFKTHSNLHIRFMFMRSIFKNNEDLLSIIYPNIMRYFTSMTYKEGEQLTLMPDLMTNEDICEIALLIFKSKYRYQYFEAIKEYILSNYPQNDLAKVLTEPYLEVYNSWMSRYVIDPDTMQEFSRDADRLFLTSATEKFNIVTNYPNLISSDILEYYQAYYQRFRLEDKSFLYLINSCHLGDILLQLIDKYLSLSTNATWRYIKSGSTGVVYQMGDYVLKLFRTKWSYEEVICPNLFLIVKNFDEIYIRDEDRVVKCGIEVQPYLKRDANHVSKEVLRMFRQELSRLGYRLTDKLLGGYCGDNCKLLDSYHDADCKDPEKLPEWFKETPLVLIDRDRIYPKNKKFVRQLSGDCY